MAILSFQKPDNVLMLESDNKFGRFEFRPLEPGYGVTIGNALRRVLLSSLEGYAICNIRIEGVEHEFATIPGVKEDVTNIILNLKKLKSFSSIVLLGIIIEDMIIIFVMLLVWDILMLSYFHLVKK